MRGSIGRYFFGRKLGHRTVDGIRKGLDMGVWVYE